MQEILFRATLLLDAHRTKKNGREIMFNRASKRPFLGKSSKLKDAENKMQFELRKAVMYSEYKLPITDYFNLKMIFYYPRGDYFTAKGNINKKIADLSNLYQLPEDMLETCRIIENDHLVWSHNGSCRLPHDSKDYILQIELTKVSL